MKRLSILTHFSTRWFLVATFVAFCVLQSVFIMDALRTPQQGLEYAVSDTEQFVPSQMDWWDVHGLWARFLPYGGRMIALDGGATPQYYFPVLNDAAGRDVLDVEAVVRVRSFVFVSGKLLEAMPEKEIRAQEPFRQSIRTKEHIVSTSDWMDAETWNAGTVREEEFVFTEGLQVPVLEFASVVYHERRMVLMIIAYVAPVLFALLVGVLVGAVSTIRIRRAG